VEVLVAAALTLLLLTMLFMFLVPSMRASMLGMARAEMQQEAHRAAGRICGDLQLSVSTGVSLTPPSQESPVYVGITRLGGVQSQGGQVFQLWEDSLVVYGWQGEGSPLVRKVWKASTPPALGLALDGSRPLKVPQASLRRVAEEALLPGVILAKGVEAFSVRGAGTGTTPSSPLLIRLVLRREAATGRTAPERYEVMRSLTLRNRT